LARRKGSEGVAIGAPAGSVLIDPFDRDAQRQVKRQAVLRAAAAAFNSQGFANTSMDEVAMSLGVTKPTLYQYFPKKEDILYECHQLSMAHAEAGIQIAKAADVDGLEKLLAFLRRYMEGMLGEFGGCPVLTNLDSLAPTRRDDVMARRSQIGAATRAFVKIGIRDGSIIDCDPALASLFALGAVNITVWHRESGPNSSEEVVDAFVDFLRASFAASKSPRRPGSPSAAKRKARN